MKTQDTYKEVVIIERPGIIARVHIPDLTEEERERRMKEVTKAAVALLISVQNRGKK